MHLVIDEWLWSDLTAENGEANQDEAFEFLKKIYIKCDQLVIVRGSKFEAKFWDLCKLDDLKRRGIAKFFKGYFFQNSKKALILEPEDLADLPLELKNKVNVDDRYLIQAQITSAPSILVTTDNALYLASNGQNLHSELRNHFIGSYQID